MITVIEEKTPLPSRAYPPPPPHNDPRCQCRCRETGKLLMEGVEGVPLRDRSPSAINSSFNDLPSSAHTRLARILALFLIPTWASFSYPHVSAYPLIVVWGIGEKDRGYELQLQLPVSHDAKGFQWR
ncbi:hypothetical protein EV2_020091 [Malus domestica]